MRAPGYTFRVASLTRIETGLEHAAGFLRALRSGAEACVTVTLLDGLVLARSAFHHSMNYRSVVVLGKGREVTDRAEKLRALDAIVEHVVLGRTALVRPPNESEIRQTLVIALPLSEASAKVRSGPPIDEEEDYALDVWAGVIPIRLEKGPPIQDECRTGFSPSGGGTG